MKFRRTFIIGFLLTVVLTAGLMIGGTFGASGASETELKAADYTVPYALSPRQTGVEILEELTLKSNTVTIRVASNGCTDKSSFRVDIQKEEGITTKAPHYVLTFYRIQPDECKAIVDEGVLITLDLQKDLGLNGAYTFSVANRVSSKPEGR